MIPIVEDSWWKTYIGLQRIIYAFKKRISFFDKFHNKKHALTVNILTEAKRWILYHLAEELAQAAPYITINKPEGMADIDYALPFYFRKNFDFRNISVGYFTHIEAGSDRESKKAREDFYRKIPYFDCCVAQNKTIETELRQKGAKRTRLIVPGAPKYYFYPKLILGFVARAREYKNDRKNLNLVLKLEKFNWIEIRYIPDFCHWSVKGKKAALKLADFYRNLDFVLVTSKSEGGPMCVLEGLSCGVPVIMPEGVGLYDHFNCGVLTYKPDYESLLALLQGLFQKKHKLFLEGQKYNLDTWRCEHIEMFDWLIREIKGN